MKQLKTSAIAFVLVFGLVYPLASGATDSDTAKSSSKPSTPDKPAAATKSAAGTKPAAVPVASPAPSTASTQPKGTTTPASEENSAKLADKVPAQSNRKADRRVAHKHKKKRDENAETEGDGDGERLNQIGAHKKVDSGFDFDNSKSFHEMGK